MKLRIASLSTVAAAALALSVFGFAVPAVAADLPGIANCGTGPTNNCLVFGDFQVFSLALLDYQAINQHNPGDPYYVVSNGGTIQNAIVVGSGNGPRNNNQDLGLPGGVDNGFDTSTTPNFQMTPGTEPALPLLPFAGDT